jgi:predicted ribosome quality control (RQC) complex YloA/Tae2 family protein
MKEEIIDFDGMQVLYYIGTNAEDNFNVIGKGDPNDLWFHVNGISSCHVVMKHADMVDKKTTRMLIKKGALLCKQHTRKLASQKNVEIIYTQIKNVAKTPIAGCVMTKNTNTICV